MTNRPADVITAAERFVKTQEVIAKLSVLRTDIGNMTLADLQAEIAELEGMQTGMNLYASMGDANAFKVSASINAIIMQIKRAITIRRLQAPRRRVIYEKGNSVLRFIAEDELGNGQLWPQLLSINPSVRYSTDLLDMVTINIP